jgi:hypothetical protein
MNTKLRSSIYFSAYPLKAYKGYQDTGHAKAPTRLFPMKIKHSTEPRIEPPKAGQIPANIELTETGWFNHYE